MKNNEKYKILFLASTTLFTIFAWSENKELANKIQAKERKALQEWFTLQARAFSIPIHQNAVIKDSIGHEMPLREIVLGGGVLALYIDMKQCDACWKKELDYLQKIQTKMRTTHSTIIIYCCPVKLKIAQDLSPNSFIIKGSDFFMIKASPPN